MLTKRTSRARTRRPLPSPAARPACVGAALLLLAACSSGPADVGEGQYPVAAYSGTESFVWCVPYAREISGVQIWGDADTWWPQAAGRYERGRQPAPYAVLALKPDRRLSDGHVAVVTGIEGPREIRVSHANWGWNSATRGRVYTNMPVKDVSEANDWSEVRFKHPAVGGYGRVYPALGFIYPDRSRPDIRVADASAATPAAPTPRVSSRPSAPASASARSAMRRLF
ncbi:CHAP domain-containing protein [Roseospira marina]|uniref:CHAP domain-containing protein n=1 Tax=Roseospira marina TaxID=140057 RepID=A0A5M6IIA6_9PROT|nr:CHAP domain-containing protein [Roseospira marina]KAA5607298.1 CHAP domain-containing protein [Roseospira marina]MBB4312545.1 surface antigen [Roseospira marina]MBB5085439.1 surface antigen [Roseospira marina]